MIGSNNEVPQMSLHFPETHVIFLPLEHCYMCGVCMCVRIKCVYVYICLHMCIYVLLCMYMNLYINTYMGREIHFVGNTGYKSLAPHLKLA